MKNKATNIIFIFFVLTYTNMNLACATLDCDSQLTSKTSQSIISTRDSSLLAGINNNSQDVTANLQLKVIDDCNKSQPSSIFPSFDESTSRPDVNNKRIEVLSDKILEAIISNNNPGIARLIAEYVVGSYSENIIKGYINRIPQLPDIVTNKTLVEQLLLIKAKVNAANSDGIAAIYTAVNYKLFEVVQLLLNHNADIESRLPNNLMTPLHVAAGSNAWKIIKLLIDNKASLDSKMVTQETPLHTATWYNSLEAAQILIDHGADLEARTEDLKTPLIHAIAANNYNITKYLLDKKANVALKDKWGQSALHYAAMINSPEITTLLLENRANVNAKRDQGDNPLHSAAWYKSLETVQVLLYHGANVNALSSSGLATPLHLAAEKNCINIIKLLIHNKANIKVKNKNGTPLHLASMRNSLEAAKLLLNTGIDYDSKNHFGCKPIHFAKHNKNFAMIELLYLEPIRRHAAMERLKEIEKSLKSGNINKKEPLKIIKSYYNIMEEDNLIAQSAAKRRKEITQCLINMDCLPSNSLAEIDLFLGNNKSEYIDSVTMATNPMNGQKLPQSNDEPSEIILSSCISSLQTGRTNHTISLSDPSDMTGDEKDRTKKDRKSKSKIESPKVETKEPITKSAPALNFTLDFNIVNKGKSLFKIWLKNMPEKIRTSISSRLERVKVGDFGAYAKISKDVMELKFIAGYRIYFALMNNQIILLSFGDKSSQELDIATAKRESGKLHKK